MTDFSGTVLNSSPRAKLLLHENAFSLCWLVKSREIIHLPCCSRNRSPWKNAWPIIIVELQNDPRIMQSNCIFAQSSLNLIVLVHSFLHIILLFFSYIFNVYKWLIQFWNEIIYFKSYKLKTIWLFLVKMIWSEKISWHSKFVYFVIFFFKACMSCWQYK